VLAKSAWWLFVEGPLNKAAICQRERAYSFARNLVSTTRPAQGLAQPTRCGAITLRSSLELMIFVFFQNLGKCR
jgi:hypothetical protein